MSGYELVVRVSVIGLLWGLFGLLDAVLVIWVSTAAHNFVLALVTGALLMVLSALREFDRAAASGKRANKII